MILSMIVSRLIYSRLIVCHLIATMWGCYNTKRVTMNAAAISKTVTNS